jgi:hypothetical protein
MTIPEIKQMIVELRRMKMPERDIQTLVRSARKEDKPKQEVTKR